VDAPPPAASVARLNNGLITKPPRRKWRAGTEPGIAVVVVPSDGQFVAEYQEPDTIGRRRGPDVVPRQGVLDVAGTPEVALVERRTDPVALVRTMFQLNTEGIRLGV